MKNKLLISLAVILLLVSTIALPIDTSAKTLADLRNEVDSFTQDLESKKNQVAQNDKEVAAISRKILETEGKIKEASNEIIRLQDEIDESNKEIEKKSKESKKIIEYYQISNGENSYLEYAFGATDITDMIYRLSIVEQLTEYNDKIMKELEELIRKNEASQKELEVKKEELSKLEKSLEAEKKKIEANTVSLRASMPSIETQIKEAKEMISHYEEIKCGENEDVQDCEIRVAKETGNSIPSVGAFARPMNNGYIVRGFTGKYGHTGYDLSSGNKSIEIYPIAMGVVHAIYTDACVGNSWCSNMGFSCNGNAKIVVIKHNYNGRYIYSAYMHLRSYGNIWVGQFVSRDTVIGYMGTSGCSSGPHLHLEMAYCHWMNSGGCTWGGYQNNFINPDQFINIPGSWNNR